MIYMVTTYTLGSLAQEFEKVFGSTTTNTYPPYNVIKFNDDEYLMEFAVAGFKKDEISIKTEKNILSIKGEKDDPTFEDGSGYLHKGIAGRKFNRSFTLPEYVEVSHAGMEDGILYIDLVRNVPEEKKPKVIAIK